MSGGGGGEQKSYQTTRNVNEPPEFLQPYLKQGVQDLTNLYNANPKAPAYYPGQTVAPLSATTQQALNALEQRGTAGSSLTDAAKTELQRTIAGGYLDPTTNPQFRAALDASLRPATENFTDKVLPAVTSQFGAAGRAGSGLHQAAVDRATTAFNRDMTDATAKVGADYIDTERGRQLAAANAAPALANQDYVDINQLGMAGQARDNQAQANVDADVARYNYDQNAQWDYINRYLASLNGGYPGGVTSGSGTTTSVKPTDAFGSIFGNAMSGAGVALSAASIFM